MIGKPEKGKMVENMLIQMAQSGRLAGKISEQELIGILENVNRQTSKTTTVKVNYKFCLCLNIYLTRFSMCMCNV